MSAPVTGPVGVPPVITSGLGKDPRLCQWFLKCENEHAKTRLHSTLGEVPICEPCDEKVTGLLS